MQTFTSLHYFYLHYNYEIKTIKVNKLYLHYTKNKKIQRAKLHIERCRK